MHPSNAKAEPGREDRNQGRREKAETESRLEGKSGTGLYNQSIKLCGGGGTSQKGRKEIAVRCRCVFCTAHSFFTVFACS